MLGKMSETEIELQCTEPGFSEFPELLFGTQVESGTTFFDATEYIHKTGHAKSVKDFFIQFKVPIASLQQTYGIEAKDIYKINKQGHFLIESSFVYLFISFVEPTFLAYICDRIHELFTTGVCVSDTYLLHKAYERLNKEVIDRIFEDGTGNTQGSETNTSV